MLQAAGKYHCAFLYAIPFRLNNRNNNKKKPCDTDALVLKPVVLKDAQAVGYARIWHKVKRVQSAYDLIHSPICVHNLRST